MPSSETTTVGIDADGAAQLKDNRQQLRHDLILSAVLVIVTSLYAIEVTRLPTESPNQSDIGPAAYPLLILVALGVCTVALAAATVRRWIKRDRREAPSDSAQKRALMGVSLIVAISVVYVIVMDPLGFVISTAIYLAALSVIMGGTRSIRGSAIALGFGCVGSLAIYLLFGTALGLLLPSGPLPF